MLIVRKNFEQLWNEGVVRNGEYNTNSHDLVKDFYTPILASARAYDRTTGGFSASGIKALAAPLVHLIRNAITSDSARPVMRIVASHDISEEDYQAMMKGYKEKAETPEDAILKILNELKKRPDEELLKAIRSIGTMIKLGLLDIKVAIPTNKLSGMYHRKIGIFTDFDDRMITFEGSQNVSFSGDRGEVNLEGLVAFCSFDPTIQSYKTEHRRFFDELWNNKLENVYVRTLDEYPKELLAGYGVPIEQILEELESTDKQHGWIPRQHQREAVDAWTTNGGRGIFDMCTGSGKSRVALMAIETLEEAPFTLIITGNLTDLIDQWAENQIIPSYSKEHVFILKVSSVHDVRKKVERRLSEVVQDYRQGFYAAHGRRVFVLAAIQSASQGWFRSRIGRIAPEKLAVVIDEVHHAGAPGPTGQVLSIDGRFRIGLSATWRRYDDDENGKLENYFRGKNSAVAYNYPISRGIKDGILSPYQYVIHPISLEPEDEAELRQRLEEYDRELRKIDASLSLKLGDSVIGMVPRTKWQRLIQLRDNWKSTLGRAISKTDVALQIVEKEHGALKKCIIYCASKQHLDRTAILMGQRRWNLEPYDSHVAEGVRKRIRDKFAQPYRGQPLFIGAIKCLDEGIDLPALDSAILVSSNKTEREWIQRRGRILRRYPGKDHSIIHDLVVLPYSAKTDAFALTQAEIGYVDSELNRIAAFAADSMNPEETQNFIKNLRDMFGIA